MATSMKVKLWGVRASVPSPGPDTVRYGGNTTCFSVEIDDQVVILDAGSGIRGLGKELVSRDVPIYVLSSHSHWDHLQGFPFFEPLYQPDRHIYMFPFRHEGGKEVLCSLVKQMDGAHFPVTPEELMSHNECILDDPVEFLARLGITVKRLAGNHPGGCWCHRFDAAGHSVALVPDNELHPPGEPTTTFEEFVDFFRGVDVLVHDAQYLPEDMPAHHGWGHSVVDEVLELGAAAQVKHLVLFHHDPDRTDDQIDAIQEKAQAWMAQRAPDTRVSAAVEGTEFVF